MRRRKAAKGNALTGAAFRAVVEAAVTAAELGGVGAAQIEGADEDLLLAAAERAGDRKRVGFYGGRHKTSPFSGEIVQG